MQSQNTEYRRRRRRGLTQDEFADALEALFALPDRPSDDVFETFYVAQWRPLLHFCQADARQLATAEDIASQAFAELWTRWGHLRDYSTPSLRGWVYAAARRGLRTSWSRRRRESPLDDTLPTGWRVA